LDIHFPDTIRERWKDGPSREGVSMLACRDKSRQPGPGQCMGGAWRGGVIVAARIPCPVTGCGGPEFRVLLLSRAGGFQTGRWARERQGERESDMGAFSVDVRFRPSRARLLPYGARTRRGGGEGGGGGTRLSGWIRADIGSGTKEFVKAAQWRLERRKLC
jgi:hypothetical protein